LQIGIEFQPWIENIISSQFFSTAVLPAAEEFTRLGKIR
jgi:hypothetical protein